MTHSRSNCPESFELIDYLAGTLERSRRQVIASHLAACPGCTERVAGLPHERDGASRLDGHATTDSRSADATSTEGDDFVAQVDWSAETQSGCSPHDVAGDGADAAVGGSPPSHGTQAMPPMLIPGYSDFEYLGSGGMGAVYRVRQLAPARTVALKILLAPFSRPERRVRFRREAELAARLEHPRIVPIYEVGEVQSQPYFTMRYLTGVNLANRVHQKGPFEPRAAAALMAKVSETVAYAHSRNVIHRDIKPLNIMIESDGEPVITDFGLARSLEDDGTTQQGQVLGTPCFMAPEQAWGSKVDTAADVYALGATLYFLITGRPPFQSASCAETIRQVIEDDAVPVRSLSPACPRDLETIVMKCLEKSPRQRYATADELTADLHRFLGGRPIAGRPASPLQRARRWMYQHPWKSAAAVGTLVVLVASMVTYEWQARAQRDHDLRTATRREIFHLTTAESSSAVVSLEDLSRDYNNSIVRDELERHLADPALDEATKTRLRLVPLKSGETQHLESVLAFALTHDKLPTDTFLMIRAALNPHHAGYAEQLWNGMEAVDGETFLRRCALLADGSAGDPRWQPIEQRLARTLASMTAAAAASWSEAFVPLGDRLVPYLVEIFHDQQADPEGAQAARLLAFYAATDAELLARLASEADARQFAEILPRVEALPPDLRRRALLDVAQDEREPPAPRPDGDEPDPVRDRRAVRRAGASVTLLRLQDPSGVLPIMQVKDDYGALSQFVRLQRERGVPPDLLLQVLREAAVVRESLAPSTATGATDATLFGLLLALGEHDPRVFDPEDRQSVEARLVDLYERDARSSVHGAVGWVMQRWGNVAPGLRDAKLRVDQTPCAYRPDREWFVVKLGPEEDAPCLTFVVFGPGPLFPYCGDEHASLRVTRRFAVSSHEITRGCFEYYLARQEAIDADDWKASVELDRWSPTPSSAMTCMSWDRAVGFCRWATSRIGDESQQCYVPREQPLVVEGEPLPWLSDVRRKGLRLPTSAEMLRVMNFGTTTFFSFGSSAELFAEYGWDHNARSAMPVGEKKPHPHGLFDLHGNADEWCHDVLFLDRHRERPSDPVGADDVPWRSLRGGGWDKHRADCGNLSEHNDRPSARSNQYGFRVALTLE